MLRIAKEALTFDDVLLVPGHSTVLPHTANISTRLTRGIKLNLPLISASMDTNELKELIIGSNKIFEARGGNKSALKEEAKTIAFAFQSVVSTRNILKGEKLSLENIFLRRPGNGAFQVNDFKKILGRRVKRNIKKNFQIKLSDI